jgi:hypothetical protein
MKRFLLVLSVVSCQLLVVGSVFSQVSPDTVNGWYVNRTIGTVNAAYSRIVDTATEETKSQAFFVSLNLGASVEWSKSFGSHRKPRFFRVDVRLNQMNPLTCVWDFRLQIYLHHGDTVQALAASGWCGNNLGRWEEYEALTNLAPVPYFLDKLTFKLFINDPGASGSFEILCDNLRLVYMNNPPQVDSIVQIDRFGDTTVTGVRDGYQLSVSSFQLNQNYPNPFNPSTVISYQLSVISFVRLEVYNVLGQVVATLVDGMKQPGSYTVRFDASNLPSGIYFYRLQAAGFIETKKLILIK